MTDLTAGILIGVTSIVAPAVFLLTVILLDWRWWRGWHVVVPLFGHVAAETMGRRSGGETLALFGFGLKVRSCALGYINTPRLPFRPWPTFHRATESGRSLVYGVAWCGLAVIYMKPASAP